MKYGSIKRLPVTVDLNKIGTELGDAQYALGRLQGSQQRLRNRDLLITPLTTKEAVASSKIEGTQSTAPDVLMYEMGGKPRHKDAREVWNYRTTTLDAMHEIDRREGISKQLIASMHQKLLNGVRQKGIPGQFRNEKVWIGNEGDPIEKATYIPPSHLIVPDLMDNLLEYIQQEGNALIQAGLTHYQFEAIHPFKDGNGRIGRLLVPLILYRKRLLSSPIIYISGFFELHRDEYIAALHHVDETHEYEHWLGFFCRAIVKQSQETQELIEKLYALYDATIDRLSSKVNSPYVKKLVDTIFMEPLFTIPELVKRVGATRLTCHNLIHRMKTENIVSELKERHKRAKIYAFRELVDML